MGKELNSGAGLSCRVADAPVYADTQAVLSQLAPQRPVYLFDRKQLLVSASNFQSGFPGHLSYAVKANTRNRVLRTLIEQGVKHFDVASLSEISSLSRLSGELSLHYNNPIKPRASIAQAYHDFGLRSFALDDARELQKILEVCSEPEQLLLSVRFKLESHHAAYDFGAKFGATPARAVQLLKMIRRSGANAALTFHPGSQCVEPLEYRRYIYAAAEISSQAGVVLAQLNVGGGFPEYYSNTNAPPRMAYFSVIEQAHQTAFGNHAPVLMSEPGRAMVARSASLVCQVIHVRHAQRTVFINDGIYGGLQEQCLADLALPLRVWRAGRLLDQPAVSYAVFGPTCDPVDRLPRALRLPKAIHEGDYIEFGLMGAYGSATSTRFNGFDSCEYINVAQGWY